MAIVDWDIRCETGTDLDDLSFTWEDADGLVNLTGATATMMVRPAVDSDTVLLTLTDTAGIALGGVAGTVTPTITAEQIATVRDGLTSTQGIYSTGYYDMIVTLSGGIRKKFLRGKFVVELSVTR